jgi:LPS O-antigen subunit length determinant protein (WzzB/FepE family)
MECKQMQDEQSQPRMAGDDEISLIDIFKVLHKRKNFIASVTLVCTFVAMGISLLLPRVYEVDAIISPATRPVTDAQGQIIEELMIATPTSIKEAIQGGAYDQDTMSKLQIAEKDFPKKVVTVPKDTNLVKISVKTDKPEVAVAIENEMISLLSNQQSEKLQFELEQIESLLKLHFINLQTKKIRLDLFNKQLKESKEKIDSLELARQDKISKAENAVAVLLYSNEIKTHQLYLNDLEQSIQTLTGEISIQKVKEEQLLIKKKLLKPLEVIKAPTIPDKPVNPQKSLITVLGFLLGLLGSVVMAFFLEFVQKAKASGELS